MDTEYIIDGAIELGEVTPMEAAMLKLNPRTYRQIRDAVDRNTAGGDDFIANVCRQSLAELNSTQVAIAGLCAAAGLDFTFQATVERLNHLVYKQALDDLYPGPRERRYFDLVDEPANVQAFFGELNPLSEESVRYYLDLKGTSIRERYSLDGSHLACARDGLNGDRDGLLSYLSSESRQLVREALTGEVLNRATPLAAKKQSQKALAAPADALIKREKNTLTSQKRFKEAAIEAAKKSIRKAVKLFQNHRKQDVLMKFLDGEQIELSNSNSALKFVIKAPVGVKDWLITKSCGRHSSYAPFDLQLLTKDDVFLARLCVFFTGTPVLDQLLAMCFFVESGAEERILEKANFFGSDVSILEQYQHVSPAISQKVEQLKSRKGGQVGQMILDNPSLRAYQWWKDTYEPQVTQWVMSWLDDAVPGLKELASSSHILRERLEAAVPQGVSLPMVFRSSLGEQLTLGDVKAICLNQDTVAAKCLLDLIEDKEKATMDAIRAQTRAIPNEPPPVPRQLVLLDVGAL